jgi:hypothetical protein
MTNYRHHRSRPFASDEPAELDGLRTIFDLKVPLFPAELQ